MRLLGTECCGLASFNVEPKATNVQLRESSDAQIDFGSNFNRIDSERNHAGYAGAQQEHQLVLPNGGTPPLYVSDPCPMPCVPQWKERHLRPQSPCLGPVAAISCRTAARSRSGRGFVASEGGERAGSVGATDVVGTRAGSERFNVV